MNQYVKMFFRQGEWYGVLGHKLEKALCYRWRVGTFQTVSLGVSVNRYLRPASTSTYEEVAVTS
jgi:hypothetical protein